MRCARTSSKLHSPSAGRFEASSGVMADAACRRARREALSISTSSAASVTLLGVEVAALAAGLVHEAYGVNAHGTVYGLAHVVNGHAGDTYRHQRFHLDAGLAGGTGRGGDFDGAGALIRHEVDVDAGKQ